MSATEMDISWGTLRQIVKDWSGTSAELAQATPLVGGSINTTICLDLADGRKAVLKITPHRVDRAHADEACQLKLLKSVGMPVPDVYACHVGSLENPFSYILMEFVDGVDLSEARSRCSSDEFDGIQTHLAELLLALHSNQGPHFTRVASTEAKCFSTWHECFRDVFDPIWAEVEKANALPIKQRKIIARVHDRLDRLLAHDRSPCLVHWDIWATNVLALPMDGGWRVSALLDPNCKYAHCEAEIAYIELFHTCTPAFMKAYQRERRLPDEYHRVRKPVYQLYSLLNHLRLFGQEYARALGNAIERVSALV
jgi:fructosamine-3-kinase